VITFFRNLKARLIADNRGWERIQARARAQAIRELRAEYEARLAETQERMGLLIAAARDRKSQEGVIGAAAAGPAEPQRPCEGFRWIAQTFRSCDRCGLPFWEHSHQERIKPGASPFGPDAFGLVPITAEDAAACKRKWGES
jgi:uncharacterized protein with PIN domain